MTIHNEQTRKGRALLDKHGLHDWEISIENLRNTDIYHFLDEHTLGYCDYQQKTIRIARDASAFRQIVLHEIAHALRGPGPDDLGGHDVEWATIADRIGCQFRFVLPYLAKTSRVTQ